MNRITAFAAVLIASVLAFVPPAAQAQKKAGTDYSELRPAQPVEAPQGKVEVVEFFWYGCPHCYTLEPALEAWGRKLPPDVQFFRVPAVLSEPWAVHARYFYTFEALGVLEKVHKPFFDAIHKDRLIITNEQAVTEWLKKHGIERKKFDEAYKSFGVQAKVKRAAQLSSAYQLDGVPMLAVQGRYTVNAEQGGSQAGMLANVDYLIDMVRKGPAKK
jgi:protein dithiol oxidoreductase (disulfide-forming)